MEFSPGFAFPGRSGYKQVCNTPVAVSVQAVFCGVTWAPEKVSADKSLMC